MRITPVVRWLEESVPSTVAKVCLFFVAAVAAWAAGGAPEAAQAAALRQLSGAATAGVFLFAGIPAAVQLLVDVAALHIETHMLMNLAAAGTLATGHALEGALLLVLFQTSHVVEHLLTAKAQGSLKALYDAVPNHATLVAVGPEGVPVITSARKVLAEAVAVDDVVLVRPGEQVPLDGVVLHGRALVSAEHITGEALPVLVRPGMTLPAGALNRDGVLAVRATALAANSTPARIARLAREAQAQRPQLRTWLERFGEVYSKVVIAGVLAALAGMVAAGVPLLAAAGQRGALYRAMGLLTVASPCALVMVPLAYVSAIAAVASRGVILKGGRVLDALDRCRVIAMDKTGTLTTGRLALTGVVPLGAVGGGGGAGQGERGQQEVAALAAAAALSLRSNHPVSDAVVLHADERGIDSAALAVADFRLEAGGGVEGTLTLPGSGRGSGGSRNGTHGSGAGGGGQCVAWFGSLEYLRARLTAGEAAQVEGLLSGQGQGGVLSVLVLEPAASGTQQAERSAWVLTFNDSVRQQSAAAVQELQQVRPVSTRLHQVPGHAIVHMLGCI